MSSATPEPRPLGQNLSYRLAFLSFMVNRFTQPVLAENGLSNQQWKVLSMLSQVQPATAQALTQWLTLDKSAISRVVKGLLQSRLVSRKLHEGDARHILLTLTPAGAALYARVSGQLSAMQADLLDGLPPSRVTGFFKTLDELEARLAQRLGPEMENGEDGEDD